MTPVMLAPIESRPASPAFILEDTPLAELNRIKQSWIDVARDLSYHKMIWDVVYWLGTLTKLTGGRECKLWQSGDVAIIANEYPLQYVPELECYLSKRSYTVWLADATHQNPHSNKIDDILFNSYPVAHWVWHVDEHTTKEIEDDLLFLPGRWLDAILKVAVQARQVAQQHGMDVSEFARRKLLTQMLAGMDI